MPERRHVPHSIPPGRSIPPFTSLDRLREQERRIRTARSPHRKLGDRRRVEDGFRFDPEQHRFPAGMAAEPVSYSRSEAGKIDLWTDVVDSGDRLSVLLEFKGVRLGQGPFLRGQVKDPSISTACFTQVECLGKRGTLWVVTRGDIIDIAVISTRRGNDSSFRWELYVPELTTRYNPAVTAASKRNNIVSTRHDLLENMD